MSRKHFTTEKFIGMLQKAEVLLAQRMKVGEICRQLGVSEQSYDTKPQRLVRALLIQNERYFP